MLSLVDSWYTIMIYHTDKTLANPHSTWLSKDKRQRERFQLPLLFLLLYLMEQEKLVPTAKQPVEMVAPATSVATSCWLFGGKLARWFCESTPRVTPQDILQQLEPEQTVHNSHLVVPSLR